MKYYITATTPSHKQSLLLALEPHEILDSEPGSDYNILAELSDQRRTQLQQDSRVLDVQLHPSETPGYEIRVM